MLGEPVRDRRAERREATRQEILDAAWDIVRVEGLAALNLRDIARRVGMQPPSLYVYFDSKYAIYDAMFAQGCQHYQEAMGGRNDSGDMRADLLDRARRFVRFCADDPARFQLLFTRTVPGFEPTPETFALSIEGYEDMRKGMAQHGIRSQADLDLWTGIMSGLASQQVANDPGGDRWLRLVDDAVDMYIDHIASKKKTTSGRAKR
jgi:AcrR family transcriptional regulator